MGPNFRGVRIASASRGVAVSVGRLYPKKATTISFITVATYLLANPEVLVALIGLLTALVYLVISLIDRQTAQLTARTA